MVSARLGEHVSSSTLSAHQMARAGEPVDSDGSDVWVLVRSPDIGKSYFWNRRTNSTSSVSLAGVEVVWVAEKPERGNVWYWNQVTGLTAHKLPPLLSWVMGYGVRGLASPHSLLECHSSCWRQGWFWRVRSSSWCSSWWATWSGLASSGCWVAGVVVGVPFSLWSLLLLRGKRSRCDVRIDLLLWTSL